MRTASYRQEFSIPPGINSSMFIACLIADTFENLPTPAQLMQRFGMCRASAYRWVGAMREVAEMRRAREGVEHGERAH